jgi:hypothetical protein
MLRNKKIHSVVLGFLAMAAIGVLGGGMVMGNLVASAQSDPAANAMNASTTPQMSIMLDRNGDGFIEGMVTAIGTNSLTLNSWGGPWTIDVGPNTQVIEHYGHPASINDFQVGDYVRVDGGVMSSSPWTISAAVVRDVTLQYMFGTFHGDITAVSGNSFTFQSIERGALMVNLASTTNITVNGSPSTASALMDGMTGMIFGNWDRANTNLTAVTVTVNSATVGTSTPM